MRVLLQVRDATTPTNDAEGPESAARSPARTGRAAPDHARRRRQSPRHCPCWPRFGASAADPRRPSRSDGPGSSRAVPWAVFVGANTTSGNGTTADRHDDHRRPCRPALRRRTHPWRRDGYGRERTHGVPENQYGPQPLCGVRRRGWGHRSPGPAPIDGPRCPPPRPIRPPRDPPQTGPPTGRATAQSRHNRWSEPQFFTRSGVVTSTEVILPRGGADD